MHRFYLPKTDCGGASIALPEGEAHHAANVLRLHAGDAVEVLDSAGGRLQCRLLEVNRRQVTLEVLNRQQAPPPVVALTLFQSVLKGKAMDWVIEKATELGARRIVPVQAERSVPRFDATEAAQRQQRWQTTAVEAIKQCGNPWLPEVSPPMAFAEVVAQARELDTHFVAALPPEARELRTHLESWRQEHQRIPARVGVWIGPEGDFTSRELDLLAAAGAQPITLGALVLRSETAAISALALLQHELRLAAATSAR